MLRPQLCMGISTRRYTEIGLWKNDPSAAPMAIKAMSDMKSIEWHSVKSMRVCIAKADSAITMMQRRNLNLEAKFESSSSHLGFKR